MRNERFEDLKIHGDCQDSHTEHRDQPGNEEQTEVAADPQGSEVQDEFGQTSCVLPGL